MRRDWARRKESGNEAEDEKKRRKRNWKEVKEEMRWLRGLHGFCWEKKESTNRGWKVNPAEIDGREKTGSKKDKLTWIWASKPIVQQAQFNLSPPKYPSPIQYGPRRIQSPTAMGPRHIQKQIKFPQQLSSPPAPEEQCPFSWTQTVTLSELV